LAPALLPTLEPRPLRHSGIRQQLIGGSRNFGHPESV